MDDLLGTRVSHYRVIDYLSKGGMGDVYVGFDEKLNRRVVLKSIRAEHRLIAEAKTRFLREARMLSKLAHPNICQIFDYIEGDAADFLVLELIPGQSLAQVLNKGIEYRQKLRIAEQIAGVLVAAHEKGIIHRDLKPDNIMLTAAGQVKVLDFGLSRSQQDEITLQLKASPSGTFHSVRPPAGGEGSSGAGGPAAAPRHPGRLTEVGMVMGTIQYMSPEQARGEEATTAGDLYSFGLILQEMFSGSPAYDRDLDFRALQKKVIAGETLPVGGIDAHLAALITRLKSPAPAARPTAVDMAERLAWIVDKPRRRRRKALLAAAIAVLALFAAAMALQTLRAVRAERSAREEAGAAKQVSRFLVELFQVSDPGEAKGNTVTAREILDTGAHKIRTELQDHPLIQARLMNTMGNVYVNLGLYGKAEILLETALRARESRLPPGHADVADSLGSLALLYRNQGRFAAAETLADRALHIREKTLGAEHPDVAASLNDLAALYEDQGKYPPAEPLYRRSLAIREYVLGPDHPDVAETINNLASLYKKQGRNAAAEPLYLRSLKIREKNFGPDHPAVGDSTNNLAIFYKDLGRYAEAEPLYQRSLRIRAKALGPGHPDVGTSLNNLAELFREQGRFAEAEPLYQRSLRIREEALGPEHPDLADSINNLAILFRRQGRHVEAEPLYQRSLKIRERALGPEHPDVAASLNNLANFYNDLGRYAAAEPLLKRSLAIWEKALGPEHPNVAVSLYNLACFSALRGRRADALAFLRRALPAGGGMPWMRAIGEDRDLVSLHGDVEFERIVAEVKRRAATEPSGRN